MTLNKYLVIVQDPNTGKQMRMVKEFASNEDINKFQDAASLTGYDVLSIEDYSPKETERSKYAPTGAVRDFMTGATQGLSYNLIDEAADLVGKGNKEYLRAKYQIAKQDSPVATAVGEWIGSIPTSLVGGASKLITKAAPSLSLLSPAIAGAAEGALRGYGKGTGEDNLSSTLKGAALGAVGGAAGSKLLPNLNTSVITPVTGSSLGAATSNFGAQIAPDLVSPKQAMADQERLEREAALAIIEQFERAQQMRDK
jgi:hypothetical protein